MTIEYKILCYIADCNRGRSQQWHHVTTHIATSAQQVMNTSCWYKDTCNTGHSIQ
jgi:hypothetical protein